MEVNMTDYRAQAGGRGGPARSGRQWAGEGQGELAREFLFSLGSSFLPPADFCHVGMWNQGCRLPVVSKEAEYLDFYMELGGS